MGRVWTRDDVLRLAPDAGSAKSGQDLGQPRKWVSLGHDGVALWGECQGSGAKPYRVQVELAEPAFKCSCPSRKFPCKHGLGLMLILATTPDAVGSLERPDWVSEWLASRAERASKAAERKERPAAPRDPAAQAKRRAQRIERARIGLADLSVWICDLIRAGLTAVPSKGFEYFDGQARRMVDAQAPGVARLVRNLGSLAAGGAGWQRPFLEQLSLVYLLARAVERFDALPENVRADVESAVGIATAADELTPLPATADVWQVIAQEVEWEDRLRVERTWLYGVKTKRPALVLQFAHGTAAFDAALSPGTQIEGELVYYPGSGPRAAVRDIRPTGTALKSLDGCASLDELLDIYSTAIAANLWQEELCVAIKGVRPARQDDAWWIVDSTGAALPARVREVEGLLLLAISGGMPVDLAAAYDGRAIRPLAVVAMGQWHSLAPASADQGAA
jgi:hypothetical protein